VFDDVEGLRKVATLKVSRRVVPINVAVEASPPKDSYFRCHGDPEMSLDASVIVGDGGADDFYFRTSAHASIIPPCLPRLRRVTIAKPCTRGPSGAISLWPSAHRRRKLASPAWKSARAAYELAKQDWVQLLWNSDLRDLRTSIVADGIKTEPNWPTDKPLGEWLRSLLRLGFTDKIIANPRASPMSNKLRGLAD